MRTASTPTLVGAAATAVLIALTSPFTWEANVLTGAVLVTGALLALWPLLVGGRPSARFEWSTMWPWMCLLVAVVAFEIVTFFSAPRISHPTLSSLEVHMASWPPAKALVAFAWLLLGRRLVRR